MNEGKDILTFEIDTTEPIPVEAFNNSIRATVNQLSASADGGAVVYVSGVRKGSYIVDLLGIAQPILPLLENVSATCTAIKNIKTTIDYLLNGGQKGNNKPSKQDLQDTKDIASPIINIDHSTINIFNNSPNAGNKVSITSEMAKLLNERIDSISQCETAEDVAQTPVRYSKVPFYCCQTGFYKNQNQGNKGMIETISDKTYKVTFQDDTTKEEMTTTPQGQKNNWQNVDYIVDVEVLRVKGNIKWYKILKNYQDDAIDE